MVNISGPFTGIPKFLTDRDEATGRLQVHLMASAGLLDWAASLQFVAEASLGRAPRAVLLDVRASAYTPSHGDAQALSDRLRQVRASYDGPIALLAASDLTFAACRIIASYADAITAPVAVFRDEPEALRWLADAVRRRA